MAETWFISDTHFSHKNILEYEPTARPFASIEEMNEAMIERWNSVVKPNDKVYHLGDFCMGGKHNVAIAGRLNGNKRLIMGNHDAYPAEEYLKYFKSIHGVLFWNSLILTHVPVHPHCLPKRAIGNAHGHLHSKQIEIHEPYETPQGWAYGCLDKRYANVSCEQNNLTPINADIILERFKDD